MKLIMYFMSWHSINYSYVSLISMMCNFVICLCWQEHCIDTKVMQKHVSILETILHSCNLSYTIEIESMWQVNWCLILYLDDDKVILYVSPTGCQTLEGVSYFFIIMVNEMIVVNINCHCAMAIYIATYIVTYTYCSCNAFIF